jgi:hypothetical protein
MREQRTVDVYAAPVLGATLPDWLNPDDARNLMVAIGVGALVLIVVVVRFVQKLVMKALLLGLLVVVGGLAWYSRADLADCAKTCDCRILGQDVKIPTDKYPQCRVAGVSVTP